MTSHFATSLSWPSKTSDVTENQSSGLERFNLLCLRNHSCCITVVCNLHKRNHAMRLASMQMHRGRQAKCPGFYVVDLSSCHVGYLCLRKVCSQLGQLHQSYSQLVECISSTQLFCTSHVECRTTGTCLNMGLRVIWHGRFANLGVGMCTSVICVESCFRCHCRLPV